VKIGRDSLPGTVYYYCYRQSHYLTRRQVGSRNVSIPPRIVFFSLQEFLLNQPINVLLDARHLKRAPTPRGLDRFSDQLGVTDSLSRFQNPHNSSLRLIIAIRRYTFVRLLVLCLCFFELDRVDLDAVLGVCEGSVECESVCEVDFS
jgi:hypothetical protein